MMVGELNYEYCAKRMYERYAGTHSAVNPLTADVAAFASVLPNQVFYQMDGGQDDASFDTYIYDGSEIR